MRNGSNPSTMSNFLFVAGSVMNTETWGDCPKVTQPPVNPNQHHGGEVDGEGFSQVKNMRRSGGGGPSKSRKDPAEKIPNSNNTFKVKREEEAERGTFEEKGESGHQAKKSKEVVGEGE